MSWRKLSLWVAFLLVLIFALELRMRSVYLLSREKPVPAPSSDVIRTLVIGDSITRGAPEYGSYIDYLEKMLNHANLGKRFEIVNEAIAGGNLNEFNQRIERLIRRYKPKVVISMLGASDESVPPTQNFRQRIFQFLHYSRIYWLQKVLFKSKDEPVFGTGVDTKENTTEKIFQNYLASGVDSTDYSRDLAEPLLRQGKLDTAIAYHSAMIETHPGHFHARLELGRAYLEARRFSQAEAILKKATEIYLSTRGYDGFNNLADVLLAYVYERSGRVPEMESHLWKLIRDENRSSDLIYEFLADHYRNTEQLEKSKAVLRLGNKFNPRNPKFNLMMLQILRKEGNETEVLALEKKIEDDRLSGPAFRDAAAMYQTLSLRIQAHGILHLASQYPVRNTQSLRKMLGSEGLYLRYVSNEAPFKRIVASGGFHDVFIDSFGGDFGHLSKKGMKFVAENTLRELIPALKKLEWLP